jgi:hypothetical protein
VLQLLLAAETFIEQLLDLVQELLLLCPGLRLGLRSAQLL